MPTKKVVLVCRDAFSCRNNHLLMSRSFLIFYYCLVSVVVSVPETGFLTFSKKELCKAEPHLETCRNWRRASAARSLDVSQSSSTHLSDFPEEKDGFIPQKAEESDDFDSVFDNIATRAPVTEKPHRRKHYHSLSEYYRDKSRRHYHRGGGGGGSSVYSVYPSLHPKDQSYCSEMRGQFAFTCQPSKPLRIDLVEFCKDYSAFCNIINIHQLPGPRLGAPPDANGGGHVDINGKFGFGVGAVPGLEVGVGWGVDVGPIPGMGENVGVGLGLDLGIMGASKPEQYRRGMGTGKNGNGVFGISGGVGVQAPGSGPIGVGSGIGVGK